MDRLKIEKTENKILKIIERGPISLLNLFKEDFDDIYLARDCFLSLVDKQRVNIGDDKEWTLTLKR